MHDGFDRREALIKEQGEIKAKVNALDKKLNDLKYSYDQYFIGLEKIEPIKLREEVQEMVKTITDIYIKSTAIKFRLTSLIAKHNAYAKLWDRILREISEGTYKRDLFRIKVKEWQSGLKNRRADEKSQLKEERAKADPVTMLFNQYFESKKKCAEPTDGLKKEKFAETITKQVSEIKKKFKCKSVSFKVVIENGKTKLKAVPKN